MFSALQKDNIFYILDKKGKPSLKIGRVLSKSNPTPKFANNYQQFNLLSNDTTVDISVVVDNETLTFEKLPSDSSIVNFSNSNVVVSDSKDAINNEIDSLLNTSRYILDHIDYHKDVVSSCEEMLKQLNPQYAKDKLQEDKIQSLETRMSGMETTLSDMKNMLSEALTNKQS